MSQRSATAKRGRPPVFATEDTELFRKLFPEITTHRGLQNRQYALRAFAVLRDAPDAFGQFAYVLGPSADRPHPRFTILTELGRIPDEPTLRATALEVCRQELSYRRAVALVRQRVRGKGASSPTLPTTVRYIMRILHDWRERYPDMNERVVLEALNEVRHSFESPPGREDT